MDHPSYALETKRVLPILIVYLLFNSSLVMENSPQSPSSSCAYLSVSSNEHAPQSPMSADSLTWERVEGVSEPPCDFEMASVISEGKLILYFVIMI